VTTIVLSDQIEEFLATKDKQTRPRKLSVATCEQYRDVLERVFLPWARQEGISDAREVVDEVLGRFSDHLESKGRKLSKESVRTYLRPVRIFLKWAGVAKGDFHQPEPEDELLDPLTQDEIDKMVKAATHKRDKLIVQVLSVTGLRVSELLGLRLSDLREEKHARVTYLRVNGKTGPRLVPIEPPLFRQLKHYAEDEATDYIFMAKQRARGKSERERLTRSGAFQLIDNVAKEAGVRRETIGKNSGIHPHLFRHSMATQWLRDHKSPVILKEILGHKSMAMIDRVYSHLNADDLFEEMMRPVEGRRSA
jgi:integrase/recombinase XerC